MTENEPKKKAKVRKDKNGVRRKSDDPKQLTDAEQSDTTKTSTNTSTATTATTTSSSNTSASSSNTSSTNNTPKKRGSNSEGKRRVKGSRISKPANKQQTEQPPPIPPASATVPPTPPEPDAATLSVIDVIVAQSQGTPPPVPPLDSSTSDNGSDDEEDSSDSDTSTTPAVPETPEARRQREIAFNAKRKQASKNERLKPNGSISDSPEIHAAANGDANESDEEDWSEECLVDVYVKRSDTKTSTKPILRAPQRFVVVEKPTTSPTVDSAAAAGRQRRVTFPASIVQRDRARVFEEKAKERLASFKLASRTELLKARLNNITEADVPDPTGPAPPLPPAKHQVPTTTPALPADDDDDGPPPPLPPSDAAAPPSPAAVTSTPASPPAPATTAATTNESLAAAATTTTNNEKAPAPAKAVDELSGAPPMPSTPPPPIGDAPAVPATPRDDGVDELPPTPVWPWRNAPADVTSLRDEFRKTIEVMAERFKLELADVQQSSNIVDKNDSAARTAKLIGVIAERDLTIAWLKRALSAVHGPRPAAAAASSSQSSSSSSGAKSDAANCPTCGTAFEAPPMPISSSPLAHKTKAAGVPSSGSASGAMKGRTLPLGNIRRRQSSETDAATAAAASAAMLGGVISPRQHYAMRERRSRDMLRLLADEAEDQERVGSEAALARLNKQSLDAKDKFEQQHRDYIEFINQKKKQLSNRK